MSEQVTVRAVIEVLYTLPADLDVRRDLYGTADVVECVGIDLENDPLAFVSDAEDVRMLGAMELRGDQQ